MNIPTILIIFGATGDLMRKKLVPALFSLYKKKKLPSYFRVVGVARRPLADEAFRESIISILLEHGADPAELTLFLKLFSYHQTDFTKAEGYRDLTHTLESIDRQWGVCTNKLFYLAVSPDLYQSIFEHLSSSGLTKPCSPEEGWTRVIVEKPFGKDSSTARKLDELLGKLFREVQIYRIDHYLAKEMLQNILAFRFSNNLFEKNWSREGIEKIDIRVWEKIGVEKRGAFYDGIGALRDVGQNHLLQMLALVTMELPPVFSPTVIRTMRAETLRTIKIPGARDASRTIRAQYEGYRSIEGVRLDSDTETYFKIAAELLDPRWAGVPVTLESGKRMPEQIKEIVILFKHPTPCLCLGEHRQNKVVFRLEPDERILIHFWSKKPGLELEMEERTFEFLLREGGKKLQYVEEYEKLLLDCIVGDQTLFVSTDEVKAMWKFIDPIIRSWKKNTPPLLSYRPDTNDVAGLDSERPQISPPKKEKKEIAVIGLGKMGMNIATRLHGLGWRVVGHDVDKKKREAAGQLGLGVVASLQEISAHLHPVRSRLPKASADARARRTSNGIHPPRLVLIMVPALSPSPKSLRRPGAKASAGKPALSFVDAVLFGEHGLIKTLRRGDIIIDGGNSFYLDSVSRAKRLEARGIRFLDMGVSGGPEGAKRGLALMVGGDKKTYKQVQHLFRDLAGSSAYEHVGDAGAGHFLKMVHNGIEYGMMQAIAEGFAVLKKSRYHLPLSQVAGLFNRGSVIESRLIGWTGDAYRYFGEELKGVSGSVAHSGEGEWTVLTARKLNVPVRVIEAALKFRKDSARRPSYAGKILTSLRNQFGGHDVRN